ncbi:nitroreductase family deazaflavin-dependent oxidoreductase [Nocardioides sediminis]|uniref:nitroreductase family deazaflavin-dependent oxidoreductase n=1 Tax=Nocardioides sediminis TaxID=433648 RepID=UPI000D305D11|nr:nitroreductase family deazaflavin-dependent oxidoreductase [Nocardioides sediminis]
MGSLRHGFTRTGNRIGVWLHRVARGRLDSGPGTQVLMVTSPGRRTGVPRSTMVRFLEHDGGYVVWGSGSGSPTDPDWFRNLRRTERARIEIGTRGLDVRPQVLTGAERDRVWREVVLAQVPGVAKYERKAGRTIPVAVLRPVSDRA